MSESENDNIEKDAKQKDVDVSKQAHLHKSISSIFGQGFAFRAKPQTSKETMDVGRSKDVKRKEGLLFKSLSIIGLIIILFFYANAQREADRRVEMEGKLMEVTTEAKALQASLEGLKESTKGSQEQIKAELEQLRSSSVELNKKLEDALKEKSKLENTLQGREKKIEELSNELAELAKIKIDLEGRLKRVQQTSEPQGENQNEIIPEEMVKKSGKILVVNPASNIVAINLGSKDGIKVGSTFDIYSLDNNFVAKLIIDEVEDTVSIGKISPPAASNKVKQNYIVKLK